MRVAYAVPHPITGAVAERVRGVSLAMLATKLVDEVTILGPVSDLDASETTGLKFLRVEKFSEGSQSCTQKGLRRVRLGKATVKRLVAMEEPPDLTIVYGGGALYMTRLQSWARKHRVRIAADMVEWYDSTHLPLGRFGPYALDNRLMMTRVAQRGDGIIAISGFLVDHFLRTGDAAVVYVPPIRDTASIPHELSAERTGPVRLVYCGDPGKKDRLDLILRSVIDLDPQGVHMRLTIAGPSRERVAQIASVKDLPPVVETVGRISRSESQILVRHAHWMPLIRNEKRFANAGFPTKVAEAMTTGTPLIANLTSDLNQILRDGLTGIVVEGPNLGSTRKAISRAVAMEASRHRLMSEAARGLGTQFFDYRQYVIQIETWLGHVMGTRP